MSSISSLLGVLYLFVCFAHSMVVPQSVFENLQPYIVVFKKGISSEIRESHVEGLDVTSFSIGDFHGYFGRFTAAQLDALHENTLIDFIEEDQLVEFTETTVQNSSTWALSSLSHRDIIPEYEYLYDTNGGEGVVAYVVDSGVKTTHEEFEGRAEWLTAVTFPHLHIDYIGHGTHVAGINGSKTYGVAKKVKIKAVGIAVGYSGSVSSVIKGIEVAVEDHIKEREKKGFKGSVMNMSLGVYGSVALDAATQAASNHGIHIAVAAGNGNDDACRYSPARVEAPLCVGATDSSNHRANFSSFGPCVDIFAPGYDVESTYIMEKTTLMSGTSMSAPHVTGLLAYYLSLYPEKDSEFAMDVTPAMLKERVLKYSTKGVIKGLDKTTTNKLTYNGGGRPVW